MYVIASNGRALINEHGQIKVWEDFDEAVLAGALTIANGQDLNGFWVQRVDLIAQGGA